MNILFVHQNFPAQFRHIALELVHTGHCVVVLSMRSVPLDGWTGVTWVSYAPQRAATGGVHPWVLDWESKVIRAEACYRAAIQLREGGLKPDLIIAHPGWGESMFLKEVWPHTRLGLYCEWYYQAHGAEVGFDPEFPAADAADICRIRLKNINNDLHLQLADAGLSPTAWQASTYPASFQKNIAVIHDGVDTAVHRPNAKVALTLDRTLRLSRADEIITFVSRNLEPLRGVHVFMRALPELLHRRPHARVLIVGAAGVSYGAQPSAAASWADQFAAEVRPRMAQADWQRVHFLGQLPPEQYLAVLQLSAVHVYLTYPFVLSWSMLEAMSVGCALVASDTAPVRELIHHNSNGVLVNFFDHQALAQAVCELLADEPRRRVLGVNARAHVLAGYDLRAVCLPRQLKWVDALNRS